MSDLVIYTIHLVARRKFHLKKLSHHIETIDRCNIFRLFIIILALEIKDQWSREYNPLTPFIIRQKSYAISLERGRPVQSDSHHENLMLNQSWTFDQKSLSSRKIMEQCLISCSFHLFVRDFIPGISGWRTALSSSLLLAGFPGRVLLSCS